MKKLKWEKLGHLQMVDVMPLLILLLLSQFLILHSAEPCPVSFQCGNLLGDLKFPYTEESRLECGLFVVKDCNGTNPSVQLDRVGQWYRIHKISQADTLTIYDESLVQQQRNRNCSGLSMKNFLPHLLYVTFDITSGQIVLLVVTKLIINTTKASASIEQ